MNLDAPVPWWFGWLLFCWLPALFFVGSAVMRGLEHHRKTRSDPDPTPLPAEKHDELEEGAPVIFLLVIFLLAMIGGMWLVWDRLLPGAALWLIVLLGIVLGILGGLPVLAVLIYGHLLTARLVLALLRRFSRSNRFLTVAGTAAHPHSRLPTDI